MSTVAENIRKRRIELQMTQEELAFKMGYTSKSTINKIESGINDISQSKISKFATVLHTTPGALMGWSEEPAVIEDRAALDVAIAKNEDLREMLKMFMALPEDKKKTVKQMVADYYNAFADGR